MIPINFKRIEECYSIDKINKLMKCKKLNAIQRIQLKKILTRLHEHNKLFTDEYRLSKIMKLILIKQKQNFNILNMLDDLENIKQYTIKRKKAINNRKKRKI